jgi:EF hand
MTLKTLHVGGISILALSLIAMPGMAMAASKAKNKTKKIECNVSVEDGEVTIEKTINGKTVKTDEDDKDCSVMVNDSIVWNGTDGLIMKQLDGADGGERHVKVMRMRSGPENEMRVFMKGDGDFPMMGEKVLGTMDIIIRDDSEPGGKAMRWVSKGSMPGGFPALHRMDGNRFSFMMMNEDNEELDLDKDGKITQAEARKARNAKLKSYDSNRDGQLSLDEYQAYWVAKRHAQMVDAFQDLDEDGDAKVTAEEFAAPAVKRAKMQTRILHMTEDHKNKGPKSKSKKRKKK